jgi:hypothetical protein
MIEFTPEEVAAQLEAKNGTSEERAAALAVLASVIAEAISLGPARVAAKSDPDELRPGLRPTN